MFWLIAGLMLFLGVHAFTMQRAARAVAIDRLGERGYKGLYTVASLVGFILIVWGFGAYRAAGYIPVWAPPVWLSHLALILNLPVFVLLAASAPAGRSTGKIQAVVKHPMLLAVKIWAAAHLLANGDLGSILLFGGFLAWAVLARISMKSRPEANPPAAASTPFGTRDWIAIGAGFALYLAFIFWLHPLLIGVRVIP